MMKIRTPSQLVEYLDKDFSWRLIELAAIKRSIQNASGTTESALLRAAVPLLYAHWEGFIKSSAICYGNFISTLGLRYCDIKESFSGLKALGYVKQLHSISKRIFVSSQLYLALKEIENEKAIIDLKDHISNIGNLDYDALEQILEFLSLDTSNYASKKQLLDGILLKNRNEIAHGEFVPIDLIGFESLMNEMLLLMRIFKTDIQNFAATKTYKR